MASSDQTPVTLAVFGAGRAGTIHFGNLNSNARAEVKYLVDLDVERAKSLLNTHRALNTKVVHPDDAAQVYEDDGVHGVIICSTTVTHEDIAVNALKHGKAVFCEKPISGTVDGTRACYETAEKAGLSLLCSLNRRFDPSLRQLKDRVASGEIGKVHVIKTCSRDHPLPPKQYLQISGGIFHDCGIHDIDCVCWIAQEYPISVYSEAHANHPMIKEINDVDTVTIVMKFQSGIIANIDLSRLACYGYDQRIEVLGMEGMIQSENQLSNSVVMSNKSGVTSSCYKHSFPQRYSDSYIQAIDHFIDVIKGIAKPEVTKDDTIKASLVVTACEESYKTGKPVKLTWP